MGEFDDLAGHASRGPRPMWQTEDIQTTSTPNKCLYVYMLWMQKVQIFSHFNDYQNIYKYISTCWMHEYGYKMLWMVRVILVLEMENCHGPLRLVITHCGGSWHILLYRTLFLAWFLSYMWDHTPHVGLVPFLHMGPYSPRFPVFDAKSFAWLAAAES